MKTTALRSQVGIREWLNLAKTMRVQKKQVFQFSPVSILLFYLSTHLLIHHCCIPSTHQELLGTVIGSWESRPLMFPGAWIRHLPVSGVLSWYPAF